MSSTRIFSVVPELLFIMMEFPVTLAFCWLFCCYMAFFNSILQFLFYFIFGPVIAVGGVIAYLYVGSRFPMVNTALEGDYTKWIEITDPELAAYRGQKIPIREAYEWYITNKISFNKPLLEVFLHRFHLFRMVFTKGHLDEIVWGVLGKGIFKHDASGDHEEVTAVYNLGNDFYYSFLADPMFYSCGVAYESSDTLEVAQARKCGICCELLDMKDGDRILDFGCGWGSWLIYVAKNFDVKATGMTISTEQLAYANKRIKDEGLESKVTLLLVDYREITVEKYGLFDKISNFEMSEHVGIRNYQTYMAQVKSLLKPEGIFFLQIAGLRRCW